MMLQSVQTALKVFETVALSGSIGVSEIARCLHISKSTAQRCLQSLHASGWIQPDASAESTRWKITSKALSLGQRVARHGHLREIALPVMARFCEEIQESVHLVVAEGRRAIVLEQYASPNALRMHLSNGAWANLHFVASGKILLAHSEKESTEQYIAHGLEAVTEKSVTDPDQLRKELAAIRRQGWAVAIDELLQGASGAAAPIFDQEGRSVAALAITVPTVRFPLSVRKKYVKLLVDAAAEISRRFIADG